MKNWLKDNAAAIGAICVVLGLFGGFAKVAVVDPIHQRFDDFEKYIDERFNSVAKRFDAVDQRFDAVDQRFDAVDQRFDSLTSEVSELRKLTASIAERVSRNEGQILIIREHLQTVDAPAPPGP